MSERLVGRVRAPEFPVGLEWLNTEQPLTLLGLRGKVVVLDFWTFCCINCQHVLPQLRRIEERFPHEVVVIGVHSAKFHAERAQYNLRQAVMRHDVRHPVVNDRNFLIWRAYAVRAWPTLTLIGPDGYVVGAHSGEFDAEVLGDKLALIVEEAERSGALDRTPLPLNLEKHKQPMTTLSFPGKVAVDAARGRLYVADTEHHRVLEIGLHGGPEAGQVLRSVGAGEPGFRDGDPTRARFAMPQGMAVRTDGLYVADTENHAIRRIDLDTGGVVTVAGTGEQAAPWPEAGPARTARLNSPWDLALDGEWLHMAMAGSHQLWSLHLPSGALRPLAGDGREALMDGPALEARLAQPSGLALADRRLWWVDSETSSLRYLDLPASLGTAPAGEARTMVGTGLFDFGDRDGERDTALLQHPLGVAAAGGFVFVADSYNHKIKVFHPRTGEIRSFAGTGEPGLEDGPADGACFWEPGGVTFSEGRLYVADTNNHAVRVIDLGSGEVSTLEVEE